MTRRSVDEASVRESLRLLRFASGSACLCVVWAGALPVAAQSTCEDRDQDGYFAEFGCAGPRDCNDDSSVVYPGALDLCDGHDNDCNGFTDEDPSCDRTCDNPEVMPGQAPITADGLRDSQWGSLAWTGDGWVVAYEGWWAGSSCTAVYLRKLDYSGTPVGVETLVSGGQAAGLAPREPRVVWTGNEIAVTWHEGTASTCSGSSAFKVYFQRFTQDLQPIGEKLRLGCMGPGDFEDRPRAVWTGLLYGVVWDHDQTGGTLYFTRISRDGTPIDGSCGAPVAGTSFPNFGSLSWNGALFGLTWNEIPPDAGALGDIYFRRIGEDGGLLDPAPLRETFDPARSEVSSLVWADDEWAASWADARTNPWDKNDIFFARFDPFGTKVNPPGDARVTCCITGVGDPDSTWNRLGWTGQEFGLAYLENNHPSSVTGDVFFQRIDRLGNTIGDRVLVTTDADQYAFHVDLAWSGSVYGTVWDDVEQGATRQVWFGRVGCNCTDDDSDGFTSCAGGDCNDGHPSIHPGQNESCVDGVDNNCDTTMDCQDTASCPAQGGRQPGEVSGMVFGGDKVTASWQVEADSDVYDILTGDLGELRFDGSFDRSDCLVWRHPSTSFAVTRVPALDGGYYYLARGKKDRCKLGTWGSTSRDEARLKCP